MHSFTYLDSDFRLNKKGCKRFAAKKLGEIFSEYSSNGDASRARMRLGGTISMLRRKSVKSSMQERDFYLSVAKELERTKRLFR